MEPKNLFISGAVVIIGMFAIVTWMNTLGSYYGVTDIGSSFNNTYEKVVVVIGDDYYNISSGIADSTTLEEGSGVSTAEEAINRQSLGTMSRINKLFGIIPSMIRDGANVLGIPAAYQNVAVVVFIFSLGITIAYILLLGLQRLL